MPQVKIKKLLQRAKKTDILNSISVYVKVLTSDVLDETKMHETFE